MVQLTHPFLLRCIDPVALLRDCLKLNTFLSSVEKQALAYGKGRQEEADKYKGWALEIFAEFLIKSFPVDKRIGITDYKVVADNDDVGVDGFGKGSNGKPATVQVKFRPADWSLTANDDHLSNFTSASQMHYGVNASDPEKNMLIVTTGKGLHYHTDNVMYQQNVRVLNREHLRVLVDDNKPFWDTFLESWLESLPK